MTNLSYALTTERKRLNDFGCYRVFKSSSNLERFLKSSNATLYLMIRFLSIKTKPPSV